MKTLTFQLARPALPDGPTRAIVLVLAALLLVGGAFYNQFFSPTYLLQQLQNGAFLGIVAIGAMMVILTGHIDLSVPWTLSASATFSTAFVALAGGAPWGELGVVVGLAIGGVHRPRQRHRRRLSAHPLDDLDAGGEHHRARRLRIPCRALRLRQPALRADGAARRWPQLRCGAERGAGLAGAVGRRRSSCSAAR